MSLIIHKVLFEKLSIHAEWAQFREDFETLSGSPVRLREEKVPAGGKQLSANIDVRGVQVGVLVAEAGSQGPAHAKACQHLLEMAAERFASILAESNAHDHEHLPSAILKTCDWIRSHALTREIRLEDAAGACRLSASHLSRLFHRSTGLTFQEYVRRLRLERACELLRSTNQPVTTIAFDSGFQSVSQFHRSFKAVHGERPLDYRRKHRS